MAHVVEEASDGLALGALEVDPVGYRASFAGRLLDVSRSQLELLVVLIVNRHRLVSREELSSLLGLARGRSVDVLLSGLRAKIGREFVRNVRNRGWIIEADALV